MEMSSQRGNVLFLILIAVALFAALSYAVLSSSRSGGSNANEETNLTNSSAIIQYPLTVQTAIMRMIINGVDPADIEFNTPEDHGGGDFDNIVNVENALFHPDGGGVSYITAPPNVMENDVPGQWGINNGFEIEDVGSSVPFTFDGNEIVMTLSGIKESICIKIHEEMGLGDIPALSVMDELIDTSIVDNPTADLTIGSTSDPAYAPIDGKTEFCVYDNVGYNAYVYVHAVLIQ